MQKFIDFQMLQINVGADDPLGIWKHSLTGVYASFDPDPDRYLTNLNLRNWKILDYVYVVDNRPVLVILNEIDLCHP